MAKFVRPRCTIDFTAALAVVSDDGAVFIASSRFEFRP